MMESPHGRTVWKRCRNHSDVALRDRLPAADSVQFLAFKAATTSQGVRAPAKLLTLTDRRWLVASDDEHGTAAVVESAFDNTLLVELTEILLEGQLKIDYTREARLIHA